MAKVRGIYCKNNNCVYYFEDNCMKIFETDTVYINDQGVCVDYQKGSHEGYSHCETDTKNKSTDVHPMTRESAMQNIADFIKEYQYTYTVNGVIDNYLKLYVKGYYVSYTTEIVVKNCIEELAFLTGVRP